MIRLAELRDLPALKSIYDEAVLHSTATFVTEARTEAEMLTWFQAHTGHHALLVYERDGRAVGYASLSTYNPKQAYDTSVELSIYVDLAARGRHIGDELMAAILDFARNSDRIHNVISLITSENEVSVRLHQKYGFRLCGRIEDAGRKFGRYLGVDVYQLLV